MSILYALTSMNGHNWIIGAGVDGDGCSPVAIHSDRGAITARGGGISTDDVTVLPTRHACNRVIVFYN